MSSSSLTISLFTDRNRAAHLPESSFPVDFVTRNSPAKSLPASASDLSDRQNGRLDGSQLFSLSRSPTETGDAFAALVDFGQDSSSNCNIEAGSNQGDPTNISALLQLAAQKHVPERHQRSLPRKRSKYLLRRSRSRNRSMGLPTSAVRSKEAQAPIMQRWQESPPKDEAASLSAIYSALRSQPDNIAPRDTYARRSGNFHTYRTASSTTSLDSGASASSIQSMDSGLSAVSGTSRASHPRRMRGTTKRNRKNRNGTDGMFKCTFCCDSFVRKYDWARHEKSLHLNIEEWQCTPYGGSVEMPLTGRIHCAYCNILDPTTDHLEQHNHSTCQSGQLSPRKFQRKDHLSQHLRLVHHLETLPLIDDWKSEIGPVVSRCGFCNITLNTWDERTDHLAYHFRKGKTMVDWHGDHGFDVHITALVMNSMAPYLIGSESASLVPYSATKPSSMDLFNQISSQIDRLGASASTQPAIGMLSSIEGTSAGSSSGRQQCSLMHEDIARPQQEVDTIVFIEVLTRHLSRFARQQMSMGIVPSDEMFQRESRRILYDGDEDDWNQTVADNPDWLAAFRQQNAWTVNSTNEN